ncbi:2-oxoglutarate dehydrogenase complex dihydrolipoyllysine-residue succinyltransferase [Nitrospirillum sp. BR 11163]|uniref:2-oxoglutarate dehydrogenase complex dihydrolipoyllysine-residue succinyltransferase n=1 Tax=Nitrospirillum sp. BR 11163 TaxID=3104323 RepID=UPI002AFF0401|nr:2-oxoglutarate dehydrogenase complex dihydrolipoyllysine-residue succinyltransferase [Nitrospirillum sp. BR 11163]MEA1677039.1 2-oxoglutarate dehydrogenase complex dihydrolipoyllysine-residue succinyltransferase [Nitrospirillum sp. BR 11163]
MATEILVPTLGESVSEATVARWLKKVGDSVKADETLVELETDKVTLEVNAPAAGTLGEIRAAEGANVGVSAVLGVITEGGVAAAAAPAAAPAPAKTAAPAPAAAPAAAPATNGAAGVMPAAAKIAADAGVNPATIAGTGKDGRVTKGDVIDHLAAPKAAPTPVAAAPNPVAKAPAGPRARADLEERVRMTRLRQTVAARLKDAQNTAAMLTTYNEVDMTNVMKLRGELKDQFEKKHGVKLGFMSFFVKACLVALKELPAVNAEIEGTDIIYKNYYDIGVAVGTPTGLVVPVVRDADQMGFAKIEQTINELGKKARDGKLSIADMTGGTFTISNGGVYGSLMSSPILNAPQSGILGMHKIQERPMVVGGQIVIRPMMYLALSYDHRIIDGREAVTFLVRVKECIENPERILLDV